MARCTGRAPHCDAVRSPSRAPGVMVTAENITDLAAQGWVSRWTTAPVDYDCFGTTTAEICGDWYGKPLRRILCHPNHVGYQEGRNGSGMHPTWNVDPRVKAREAAEYHERLLQLRLEDEARRLVGLAWLAAATQEEIDDAEERDDVESRGLTYLDLRDEAKRRADIIAEADRAATWDRCRASFEDGTIIVDNGTPGQRGVYGWVSGQPTRIYYGCRVTNDWRKVADEATVEGVGRDNAGSLEMVADYLATGRMRIASADEVPPEPVTRRIGRDHWRDIVRVEIAGKVGWVGRALGAYDILVLDAAGRLHRSKSVRDGAIAAFKGAKP